MDDAHAWMSDADELHALLRYFPGASEPGPDLEHCGVGVRAADDPASVEALATGLFAGTSGPGPGLEHCGVGFRPSVEVLATGLFACASGPGPGLEYCSVGVPVVADPASVEASGSGASRSGQLLRSGDVDGSPSENNGLVTDPSCSVSPAGEASPVLPQPDPLVSGLLYLDKTQMYGSDIDVVDTFASQDPLLDGYNAASNTLLSAGVEGFSGGEMDVSEIAMVAAQYDPKMWSVWSEEENATLLKGLACFANDGDDMKYLKIAFYLPQKTAKDVALRCRWLKAKKDEEGKKDDDMVTGNDNGRNINSKKQFPCEADLASRTPLHLLRENNKLLNQIENDIWTMQLSNTANQFYQVKANIEAVLKRIREMNINTDKLPPTTAFVDIAETALEAILPRMQGFNFSA